MAQHLICIPCSTVKVSQGRVPVIYFDELIFEQCPLEHFFEYLFELIFEAQRPLWVSQGRVPG